DSIVDWGDLSSSHITSATDPDILHNYSGAGTYTVTISGIMEGFCMAGVDAPCLTAISGGSCHIFKFLGGDVYGYGAFDECINLVTANIPDWNISQVTDLTYLFWECHSLEVCHLENWDTSSVTLMVDMWDDATFNLTSIDLSNWNTSNVTSFSDMFTSGGGASALTEIIGTENWDVSSATNMSGMFEGLDGLLTINLTGWDTTNVTDMNHMFSDCTSLTTAMDSSIFWDNLGGGTSVLNYTLCFYNATNISNYASIPAGWK
ncbi:MAG: BspA family leucine-rich repeat surface protein, partial [Tissierellales bacterium]|nr:BspA family leucine-rich repeat surface protein [Tissierellales bacterium]